SCASPAQQRPPSAFLHESSGERARARQTSPWRGIPRGGESVTRAQARTRARGLLRPRSREVTVARLHGHGLLALEVADAHGAALDPDEGAVALVLGEPRGPADRRRRVLARGAELALPAPPQLAEHRLQALLLVDAANRARRARELALHHDVRDEGGRLLRLLLGERLLDL